VEGKKILEKILPKSDKTLHELILNKQVEQNIINKNGDELTVEISVIAVEQDDNKYYCYFIKDISERKGAEDRIKRQEEKYRNIIANMNLGLLEVDNNETIRYANQSFL
jgi:PAS domain-containing protein